VYIETRRKNSFHAIRRQCHKKNWGLYVPYMAPYLINHYLRKYLIKIWRVLYYRRHHTFDVKTCFQQNRYVFDVIVTSWALFVFCISWNFARDISTVFEEIKHLRSRASEKYFTRFIKINKPQILLKYFLGARGVKEGEALRCKIGPTFYQKIMFDIE
jgi:hypothetical protein